MSQFASKDDLISAQASRITELEAELEAVGAGGVQRLAAAPQAAVPLFWVRLLRDGLYEGPVHNNSVGGKMLRDEKPGEWHPLYLHAAPAYPAEGVHVQVAELEVDDLIDRLLNAQQDLNLAANVHMDQSIASASTLLDEVEIALRTLAATQPAAQPVATITGLDEFGPLLGWHEHWAKFPVGTNFYTQPAAQGLDAATLDALQEAESVLNSINMGKQHKVVQADGDVTYWQREEWCKWAKDEVLPKVTVALAAQAKQGEQANG